jgi:CubicO group peptidase (beta-lactamase class C family)
MILMKFLSFYLPLFLCFSFELRSQSYELVVDSFLSKKMEEFRIPAVSVAIIDNGAIVMQRSLGMANIEFGISNTDSTAFQMASVTKLISATALMILAQEGKIDLNQDVRHYLPDLPETWRAMKVYDLVSHQSGIVDLLALQHLFRSLEEAMDTATSRPLDFPPGTKTVYAGGDYAVVMLLIETITGLSFQEFLDQYLFSRLNMKHSVFNNMEQDFIYRTYDIMPYAATTYKWNAQQEKQQIFSMLFPRWTYPAGGLFSSIADLATWIVALDRDLILRPEFRDQMWTSSRLRDETPSPFGVGWIVDKIDDEKATGHSGGPALADVVRLPEKKISVIILTNQLELRPMLASQVLRLYLNNRNP